MATAQVFTNFGNCVNASHTLIPYREIVSVLYEVKPEEHWVEIETKTRTFCFTPKTRYSSAYLGRNVTELVDPTFTLADMTKSIEVLARNLK